MERAQHVAAAHRVAHALMHDHAHGQIQRIGLVLAARAQTLGGVAHVGGADGLDVARFVGAELHLRLRFGQQRRVLGHAGIAALGRDHLGQLAQALAVFDLCAEHVHARRNGVDFSRAAQNVRAKRQRDLQQIALRAAGEHVDGLLHLQRVAHVVAQRLIHVGDQRGEPLAAEVADAHHCLRQLQRFFIGVHDRAAAGFHVQHHHVAARGQLLGQNGRDHQRQTVHRRGHVAQSVERLVRRGERRRLTDDGAAHVCDLPAEGRVVQIDAHAGDGLQLVQRAAGEAQSAAGHLGHFHAAGGHQRHENQRGGVAHAAGGVLVGLHAGNVA